MKDTVAERMKQEWMQMTLFHKVRLVLCINVMIVFSWAFLYYASSKIVFNLIAYHYASTSLYHGNQTMIEYLTGFYDMTFWANIIFDLTVYLLCMIGLMLLAKRERIFSSDETMLVKDAWRKYLRPKKKEKQRLVTETLDGAYDVLTEPDDMKLRVDKLLEEKKQ